MRKPQRLHLDFRRERAPSPWAGRLLLVVAIAFAADVGIAWHDTREALDRHKEQVARMRPRAVKPLPQPTAEELAAVRDTVERIGTPWETLFSALEQAASDDIALVGIEPDPKAGTVILSGSGKSYLAALSYVQNLDRTPALQQVQLVRHQAAGDDPDGPVSFAVSAAWKPEA